MTATDRPEPPLVAERKRRRPVLRWGGVALALWLIGLIWFVSSLPKPSTLADAAAQRSGAIVVLTGGAGRLRAGLHLLEAGAAERLFVSGVHHAVEVSQLLALAQRDPEQLECCVVLGYEAADTAGNAAETAAWMQANGVARIHLVTARYHMPRALAEFRRLIDDTALIPVAVAPPHLTTRQGGIGLTKAWLLVSEFNKYLVTRLSHLFLPVSHRAS